MRSPPARSADFLKRIHQFDEQVAHQGLEPVRRWVHNLKCRVLDLTAANS